MSCFTSHFSDLCHSYDGYETWATVISNEDKASSRVRVEPELNNEQGERAHGNKY